MTIAQGAWLAEHKGEYVDTIGLVWECGDDYCNCTQAQIVDRFKNRKVPAVVSLLAWEGTFFTDREQGADAELAAKRRELARVDPDREAAITWQEGVDYDT